MLGHARVTREKGGTRWWETLPIQVLPSFVGVAHSRRLISRVVRASATVILEGWDVQLRSGTGLGRHVHLLLRRD